MHVASHRASDRSLRVTERKSQSLLAVGNSQADIRQSSVDEGHYRHRGIGIRYHGWLETASMDSARNR